MEKDPQIYWYINLISNKYYSFGGSVVKNLPGKQDMWIRSQGWEYPLEKEMEPTPVFLLGKSHRGAWWAIVHTFQKESDMT